MRIVALSDQHGHLPLDIPACDLLLVGGDVCPDRIGHFAAHAHPERQKAWFDRHARPWLAEAPAAHRVLTWGNHDWCGEECSFAADAPGRASSTDLQIVVDRQTSVLPAGASRPLTIWASPWSNQFMEWAFMKSPAQLAALYATIPEGIDILMSHQPPFEHGDLFVDALSGAEEHPGSHELLATIDRVRPQLVICGHFHAGYGQFRRGDTLIYNVAVVNDAYELVRRPTVIDIGFL